MLLKLRPVFRRNLRCLLQRRDAVEDVLRHLADHRGRVLILIRVLHHIVRGDRRGHLLRPHRPHRQGQRPPDGPSAHPRRAEARVRGPRHRGDAVLRLRPEGPQGQGAGADQREAGRGRDPGRGREPRPGSRAARGADPGVLRHPGGPPLCGSRVHTALPSETVAQACGRCTRCGWRQDGARWLHPGARRGWGCWNRAAAAGEAAGPESVWQAVNELHANRIGHAVRALEDSELVRYLADKKVGIEANLTSNVQTSTVSEYSSHPLRQFLENGLLATINTDDPGISGIDLIYEYEVAAPAAGLTKEQIRQAQRNSLEIAFLSSQEKIELANKKTGSS